MNYEKFTEFYNEEMKFLDTLDLTEAMKLYPDVYNLMDYIEEKYKKDYKLEPFIFNCMNSEDFVEYLKRRYDIGIIEEVKYTIMVDE